MKKFFAVLAGAGAFIVFLATNPELLGPALQMATILGAVAGIVWMAKLIYAANKFRAQDENEEMWYSTLCKLNARLEFVRHPVFQYENGIVTCEALKDWAEPLNEQTIRFIEQTTLGEEFAAGSLMRCQSRATSTNN